MEEEEREYVKVVHRGKATQGVEEEDVVVSLAVLTDDDPILRQVVAPDLVVALLQIGDQQLVVVADRRHYSVGAFERRPFRRIVYSVSTPSGSGSDGYNER